MASKIREIRIPSMITARITNNIIIKTIVETMATIEILKDLISRKKKMIGYLIGSHSNKMKNYSHQNLFSKLLIKK